MTLLGSDVDQLSALTASLRRCDRELTRIASRWSRSSRSAPWWGPDARRFELEWSSRHGALISSAATAMSRLADDLDRQVRQQVDASNGDGANTDSTSGTRSSASSNVAGTSGGSHQDHRPVLPPGEEQRFSGSIDLRVGLGVAGSRGEVSIAELGRGQRRVTWSEEGGVGATASLGSSAELSFGGAGGSGGGTNGVNGTISARLGLVERQSWVIDSDEVDDLLARLAFDRASSTIAGVDRPLDLLASGADRVVDALTGVDPGLDVAAALLAPPRPARTESLIQLDVAATAAVGSAVALGLGARGTTSAAVRIGVGHGEGGSTRILEVEGSTTASATATALRKVTGSLPVDFHSVGSLRIEQPVGDPGRLVVKASTVEDQTVRDVVAVVHLDPDDSRRAASALSRALDLARSGDASALDQLVALGELDFTRLEVASSIGSIDGHSARAGANAAVGIGGGATLRGSALHIERRPS